MLVYNWNKIKLKIIIEVEVWTITSKRHTQQLLNQSQILKRQTQHLVAEPKSIYFTFLNIANILLSIEDRLWYTSIVLTIDYDKFSSLSKFFSLNIFLFIIIYLFIIIWWSIGARRAHQWYEKWKQDLEFQN